MSRKHVHHVVQSRVITTGTTCTTILQQPGGREQQRAIGGERQTPAERLQCVVVEQANRLRVEYVRSEDGRH